ncbi:MAG: ribonuclease J [Candidatus Pacearchaeota archaeon]|nr:MAG: ribonuclease J [Candidatus Pacearchaeota archaeon]
MEICTVGGYEQVGKNMTAVKIGEDVFIFDAGLYLPAIVEIQEQEKNIKFTEKDLRRIGAIPDDLILDKLGWREKVRAIIIGHAHLDHVGALPFIAYRYPNAIIMATPFTMHVFDSLTKDENITIKNPKKIIMPDSVHYIKGKSSNYKIEFIHTTHSTLQCVFAALHTNEGIFFYALDFKFDNFPVIGDPPRYKKLGELGRKGIKALVIDALYSGTHRKTPSERIARYLVEETFNSIKNTNGLIIATTFSSHIARLKSIVDFGKRLNRKIIFVGRSLEKYVSAAIKTNLCPFKKDIKMIKFRKQVNSFLSKIERNRREYLVVCTGHQGEPGSVLDRISRDETPLKLREGDHVVFCSSVIPDPVNINARDKLDKRLRKKGVRLHTDIHVSGHGSREDMRDLIKILKPKHVIPAHGSLQQEAPLIELASELGYKFGETSHLSSNGKVLKI